MRIKYILSIFFLLSLGLRNGYAASNDTPPDSKLTTIKGHNNFVKTLAFHPEGKYLASGSGDGSIKIWQAGDWKELADLRGHNGNVFSVAFSPDGKFLASGSNDSTIKIWRVEDWKEITTIFGNTGPINSVAFSSDGEYLASGSYKVIKIWKVKDWKELATLTGHLDWVNTVTFSRDGRYLATGSGDGTAKIWLVKNWLELTTLEGHRDWVNSVTFSPDGKYLATGSGDTTIKIWQVKDWKESITLTGHKKYVFTTAFSPDGKYLVTGSADHTIKLWRVEDWYNLGNSMKHKNQVLTVVFHPNGEYLASGCWDSTIDLWDMDIASIDWSTGQPSLPPYLTAKLEMVGTSNYVSAGSFVTFRLKIENKGKGDAYRLSGEIDSRLTFFKDCRFVFGKVGVGEVFTREIKVEIPEDHFTQDTKLKMRWQEANDYIPNPIKLKLHIEARHRPEFTYNYIVVDDFTGKSMGNGDGRIHKGETIELLIGVLNIGKGKAENVNVEIKSLVKEGLRLHTPKSVIAQLDPGEYKRIRLAVTVLRTGNLLKLPLELIISDPIFGVKLEDKLYLPIEADDGSDIAEVKQIMKVNAQQLSIFGATKEDSLIIGQINRGAKVMVTGFFGGWSRIKFSDDQSGWVSMMDLTETSDNPDTFTQPAITELYRRTPPVITIKEPEDNTTISDDKVMLSGNIVAEQSIARVEIEINGEKLKTLPEAGKKEKKDLLSNLAFNERIPLKAGKNTIVVTGYDSNNLTHSRKLTITRTVEKEETWAVLIGIGKYENKEIKPVKYASNNVKSMKEYLINNFGIPKENVTVLLDKKTSLAEIKNKLGVELSRKIGKEDKVIIYLTGRGVTEKDPASLDDDGFDKYFLTYDTDPEHLYSTALSMEDLAGIFGRIKAERVIFLIDFGFAKTFDGKIFKNDSITDKFWGQLSKSKGRIILSAGNIKELIQERDDLKHGLFTYYLLEGLRGKADLDGDKMIDTEEIYKYICPKISLATGKLQNPIKRGESERQIVLGRVK